MSANIRELLSAVSIHKQLDIVTLPADADFVCIPKVNAAAAAVNYINETDALDAGKGDEWARQVFSSNIDAAVDFEKYASSEIGAFLAVFAMGSFTKSTPSAGVTRYVGVPLEPVDGGIDLPQTAYIEQVRSGAASIIDRALIGCVVQSWSLELASGPGRQNTKIMFQLVGTGNVQEPSGVVIPIALTEHAIKPYSFVVGTEDYVTLRRFVSLTVTFNNNIRLDQGYYPGSGYDPALFQMRGRLENGDRTITIQAVVRMEATSTEFAKLKAKTHGPCSVFLVGDPIAGTTPQAYHRLTIDCADSIISSAVVADDAGILTVQIDVTPIRVGTTPILQLIAETTIDTIGDDAAIRPPLIQDDGNVRGGIVPQFGATKQPNAA